MTLIHNKRPMADVLEFVTKREAIRTKHKAGLPPPYTDDEILSKYRFCNIRRRDDRVSQWLLKHYYPVFSKNIWLAATIARYINWPPTLQRLLDAGVISLATFIHYPEHFENVIKDIRSEKGKIYTGAYMVYPGSKEGKTFFKLKEEFIARYVMRKLVDRQALLENAILDKSVQRLVNVISGSYGFSTFMAGQIAADLTYIPGQLDKAHDLYRYAPMGPGSIRGLNRLYEQKLGTVWDQQAFNEALIDIHATLCRELQICDLTLHDVQNIMCEMDKYWRVRNGEGRPRASYKPETAYNV